MAFVVEDGTGIPDANSFVTVAFADDYFAERGDMRWEGEDDAKKAWLIQATDYTELRFSSRYIGTVAHEGVQGLAWPREDADPYAEDEIPLLLQRAICEYAVRAKSGPLIPDPVIDSTGFAVVTTRKKVGPIEKEFKAQGSTSQPMLFRPYPAADGLIQPLLRPGMGGTRVIR